MKIFSNFYTALNITTSSLSINTSQKIRNIPTMSSSWLNFENSITYLKKHDTINAVFVWIQQTKSNRISISHNLHKQIKTVLQNKKKHQKNRNTSALASSIRGNENRAADAGRRGINRI